MKKKTVAIIVAHPYDETLWAGGVILKHSDCKPFVACLSRKSDTDRAPKFFRVLKVLNADGRIGDLDDGPVQIPLNENDLDESILELLPSISFDIIITHSPAGEYTRHIRHEEIGKAVIRLWKNGRLHASELWIFAYEDGNKEFYPRPMESADISFPLSQKIWKKKYSIITEIYGFEKNSFEAMTTPRSESFWQFNNLSEVPDYF